MIKKLKVTLDKLRKKFSHSEFTELREYELLQERNDEIQAEILLCEAEKKELKKILKENNKKLKGKRIRKTKAENRATKYEGEDKKQQEEIATKLSIEIEDLEETIEAAQRVLDSKFARIEELRDEHAENNTKHQFNLFEEQRKASLKQLEMLQNIGIDSANAIMDKLEVSIQVKEFEVKKLLKILSELSKVDLQALTEELKKDCAELEKAISELEAILPSMEAITEELKEKVKKSQAAAMVWRKRADLSEKQDSVELNQMALKESEFYDEQVKEYQAALNRHEENRKEIESQCKNLRAVLEEAKQELASRASAPLDTDERKQSDDSKSEGSSNEKSR